MTQPLSPLPDTITLSHGSGGRDMHKLLEVLVLPSLCAPSPAWGHSDSAEIAIAELAAAGDRLAFTTDGYTVSPLFFAGGNIGSLAVNGTVNDLAMSGAVPRYLSCSLIIEEGFKTAALRRILATMREAADSAGVRIIAGDTKVVPRGATDGIFITTTGIGTIADGICLRAGNITPGDAVIVSGYIGDHGAAILAGRDDIHIDLTVNSDCAALNTMVAGLLESCPNTRLLRDATRGGIACVLNEIALDAGLGMTISDAAIPVRQAVRAGCEIFGLDPLYLANEGTLIAVIPAAEVDTALTCLQQYPQGRSAALIGHCIAEHPGVVALTTGFGAERVLDVPAGELLPRIC